MRDVLCWFVVALNKLRPNKSGGGNMPHVTTLKDFEKVIDDYILESSRNMASIETLENLMARKFSTYKPSIVWKIKLMAQSGIIKETENVGVFKLIGSGKLKFIEKSEAQSETSAPATKKKPAKIDPEEEKAIDNILGVDV